MVEERCGTCRFWPLSAYAEIHGLESGQGGHHTDGSVSRCTRRAPIAVKPDRYPSATAVWPETERTDWCGEWQYRPHHPQGRSQ